MPAAIASTHDLNASPIGTLGLVVGLERLRVIAVAVLLIGAFSVRAANLASYGFSEDEINKVHAIDEYRHGRFGANAEHPMLMKLAMWASASAAAEWNRAMPAERAIPLETAIRLPNALAGAATTLVVFAIVELLFSTPAAFLAAALWAFDVNAIAINRIGKEDTFLLLFFLAGVWCYERAKWQGASDPAGAQRWYAGSGAAFGLMLASKYMPHFLGIYALFNAITDDKPGANRPDRRLHFGAMALTFAVANLVIFLPDTWRYAAHYVQGGMLIHHGSPYAGHLYVANIPVSPLGVPATFYLRLLATKVPLAVLGAAVAGGIELVRRRHERGYVLLRVLIVFLLLPYSLMAAKFLRYALPLFAAVDIVAAVGMVAGLSWLLRKGWLPRPVRIATALAAVAVFAVDVGAAPISAAPFYSVFQNAAGDRLAEPGTVFPEETYDFGVREAVAAIAASAEPGAVIVSDASAVVSHYVGNGVRRDLRVAALSGEGLPSREREVWVIVQDEHLTFENQALVSQLRGVAPWREFAIGAARAAQVFRIERK